MNMGIYKILFNVYYCPECNIVLTEGLSSREKGLKYCLNIKCGNMYTYRNGSAVGYLE